LEGEGRVLKKGKKRGRNREVWGEGAWRVFFFITQKPPNLGELKNCIRWRSGEFI
jgi:hypothetical protein